MASSECLIIDDVSAALAHLTEFGRAMLRDAAMQVRDSLYAFAERRRWSVVRYESFAQWAGATAEAEDRDWITLDPLYGSGGTGRPVTRLRMSRRFSDDSTLSFDSAESLDSDALGSRNAGLIDDAASSGSTIRRVQKLAAERGGQLRSVILCASTEDARRVASSRGETVRWSTYVPGDWRVVHLRDGCPFLPFSGRPSGERITLGATGASIEKRIPAHLVEGNLWQALHIDRDIRGTVETARRDVLSAMTASLGRVPLVGDLALLGNDVSAHVTTRNDPLNEGTALHDR